MNCAYRYVRWEDVERRFKQGYALDTDLGPPHSYYSVLMIWLCSCGRDAP